MADATQRDAERDAAEVQLNRLLNMVLESAVEALGFDAGTVSARHEHDLATVAATDQRMVALDDAQYDSGEGPCLQVLDSPDPLFLAEAGNPDERWMHFSKTASQLGVRSSLSLHLPVDSEEVAASLNLYAKRQMDLSAEQVRKVVPVADQLAAAMQSLDAYRATAALARNMAEAMRSRAVIEQAKGMLMAEFRIDAKEAFARLSSLSQRSNTKLRDVAGRIVEARSGAPAEFAEPGSIEVDFHDGDVGGQASVNAL